MNTRQEQVPISFLTFENYNIHLENFEITSDMKKLWTNVFLSDILREKGSASK